jgi:UDPglucose 6-dehydrogenase
MLRITVLGTGYVGLVSGVCLAETGHHVTCIDKNAEKIASLKANKIPIYEDSLEELTKKNAAAGRLEFSTALSDSLNKSDIVIIAVGTPTADEKTGAVDLSYINACVDEIAQVLTKNIVVIVKSTVPVGTCDKVQERLNRLSKFECAVVSNPEFLREGSAVYDFMNPDRIVFGSDGSAGEIASELYSRFEGTKIIHTDRKTAELIKYASNAFLAMKVGFINEMSDISEKVGADIKKLSDGIGSDKRIGDKFLNPGPGFGGSCFPKDVMALLNLATEANVKGRLIKSIMQSNEDRFEKISQEIVQLTQEGSTITILGLTYKAGTDDVRDSPAIEIINRLTQSGDGLPRRYAPRNDEGMDAPTTRHCERSAAIHLRSALRIKAYDPEGMEGARAVLGDRVECCSNVYEACSGASLIVITTEWEEFKRLDAVKLKTVMKDLNIYDLRGVIDKEQFSKNGFKVKSIGYKTNVPELCSS